MAGVHIGSAVVPRPDRCAASGALAAVGVTARTSTAGGSGVGALEEAPITPPRIAASTLVPSKDSTSATSHALRSDRGMGA